MAHPTTRSAPGRQEFPLEPLKPLALGVLAAIGLAVIAGVTLLPASAQSQPLPLSPWLFGTLIVGVVLATMVLPLLRRRIVLEGRTLRVAATFYTRTIAVEGLDLDKARIVSLAEHTELKPMLKTNGYSLPGLNAGHFRLRNRSRAFCLLTSHDRVVVLPQHDGAMLLLSPQRPQALLDALRAVAHND